MRAIISITFFLILLLWIFRIYFTDKKKFRLVEYTHGEKYLLSRNMYFCLFTVCTAPVFLGSFALLKYGLWTGFMLFLLISNRLRLKLDTLMILYIIFFIWLVLGMTYTNVPRSGFMMLVKYSLPLLFLFLGYSALNNEKDLIVFLTTVNVVACVYCFFIGGQGYKLIPWFYFGPIGWQFATYASFANFLTSIFIVPIILYWLTKDKKFIFCALWMVLSTILEAVRTGMGGMVLVFGIATFLRYKTKSLPGLFAAGAMFIGVILFVPSVNEKFFGEDAGTVTGEDIVQGNALSLDNIEMSGREYTWERAKVACYYGNELFGSGLGESGYFIKYSMSDNKDEVSGKMHNDYLELLCDSGLVGIILLAIFYVVLILKVFAHVVLRRSTVLVKLTGIMALSTMAGIGFSMYFDNVVSMSMQAMVMPYIYLGFFLKALDIEGKNKRTLAILRFRKERV